MSEQTAISWCDSTFNPWIGCTKVSPACDHCYAARQDAFRKWTPEGWGGPRRRTSDELWGRPGKWNASPFFECADCRWRGDRPIAAELAGGAGYPCCASCGSTELRPARRRVFCASLADVFDNQVPPEWRVDLFRLIAATPHLDWLLLTKRIGNVVGMVPVSWLSDPGWPHNVRLGITVCNQPELDRDGGKLLALGCPNFLSIEPMLSAVELSPLLVGCDHGSRPGPGGVGGVTCVRCGGHGHGCAIDWVICGGESGPQARPFALGHAKEIVRQCKAAGVAVHVKQLGARPVNREGVPHPISDRSGAILSEWPEELRVQEFPA